MLKTSYFLNKMIIKFIDASKCVYKLKALYNFTGGTSIHCHFKSGKWKL